MAFYLFIKIIKTTNFFSELKNLIPANRCLIRIIKVLLFVQVIVWAMKKLSVTGISRSSRGIENTA